MEISANEFRESRISIVEFIASYTEQLRFASEVFYKDYAEEFYEWWFEERSDCDQYFLESFRAEEMEALVNFSNFWLKNDAKLEKNMPIEILHSCTEWKEIVTEAEQAIKCINY